MIAELLLTASLLTSDKAFRVAYTRDKSLLRTAYAMAPDVVASSPPRTTGGGGLSAGVSSVFTASQIFNDDVEILFGTGSDAAITYNTAQTPDALFIGVAPDTRSVIIAERADKAFDFAHAQSVNPTVFIHSSNQSTTQWGSLSHDGTTFNIQGGTNGGIYFLVSGTFRAGIVSPTAYFAFDAYPRIAAASPIVWSSAGSLSGVEDLILGREAAATLQFGADVNGAAVPQILKAHDGITGTNIAGANFTLAGGRGTGTGAGGNVVLQTSPALASGTTAQTLADRAVTVAKPKTLTESSATAFWRVAVASATAAGGTLTYCTKANDGTNQQIRCGYVSWAAINEAGTESCTFGTAADVVPAGMTGTLTVAFTCPSNSADTVDLSANAVSSLTQTTLELEFHVIRDYGAGTMTAQ